MGAKKDQVTMKKEHRINISIAIETQPKLPCLDLLHGTREEYFNICVPLYQASITGNWAAAKAILDKRPELVRFAITEDYDTSLHIAASAEETNMMVHFVENLVEMMDIYDLELLNQNSNTALCLAAAAGNVKLAKLMVKKNRYLTDIPGNQEMIPLFMSALNGRHRMVKYLYDASWKLTDDWWNDENLALLLLKCVEYDFFDIALKIVQDYPKVAMNGCVLGILARKPEALNGVEQSSMTRIKKSIMNVLMMMKGELAQKELSDAMRLLMVIWEATIRKMPKDQVTDILRGPSCSQDEETPKYPSRMLFVAAEMGNTRFLVELLRAYPDLIWQKNDDGISIFHIAVMHRHQGIYNLLYEIGSRKDLITQLKDKDDNNMLHLVGKTSRTKTAKTSGASLLMQRELLWFKEVERMIPPSYREEENKDGQTPCELFLDNNYDLVAESLKWVKECMVVATLIVTVAFAVAFTVPGGYNQEHGFPIFIHKHTFLVFVIADAISLFSSSTSLLVYLSILASRYDRIDRLISLTKNLMLGLVTLFISVAALMVTFSASFFVIYHKGLKWVPITIAISSIMPIIVFAILQ